MNSLAGRAGVESHRRRDVVRRTGRELFAKVLPGPGRCPRPLRHLQARRAAGNNLRIDGKCPTVRSRPGPDPTLEASVVHQIGADRGCLGARRRRREGCHHKGGGNHRSEPPYVHRSHMHGQFPLLSGLSPAHLRRPALHSCGRSARPVGACYREQREFRKGLSKAVRIGRGSPEGGGEVWPVEMSVRLLDPPRLRWVRSMNRRCERPPLGRRVSATLVESRQI